MRTLYVYIDESGNFDFSAKGTKLYVLTAVLTFVPTEGLVELCDLKHKILSGEVLPTLDQEYKDKKVCHRFHATEDKQLVRDEVFKIIGEMKYIKAHSIVVQKNKTNPALRTEAKFYSLLSKSLLKYIQKVYEFDNLCICFNGLATKKRKEEFIKSIKLEIASLGIKKPYSIYFPNTYSNKMLDVTDYINWAIYVKWERNEMRSYELIKKHLGQTELDYFRNGTTVYY